jgi:hypothetical protein
LLIRLTGGKIIARGDRVQVKRPGWQDKTGVYDGKDKNGKFKVSFEEHGGSQLWCDHAELVAVEPSAEVSAPVEPAPNEEKPVEEAHSRSHNSVKVSGTLEDWPTMHDHEGGWQSVQCHLRFDKKRFRVPLFTSGNAAKNLMEFKKGDEVLIFGSLAMSPKGTICVIVKDVRLRKAAEANHHEQPLGVKELGLNRMSFEEFFLSKADS